MDKDHIAKSFFIITNKFKRYLDKKNQLINLSNGQARILRYIYDKEKEVSEVFQKDIEEEFSLRGASVTGIIDGLVKLGCLRREIHKTDRRKKQLKITDYGLEVVSKSFEIIKEFEENLRDVLTEDELEQLENILMKLEDTIDIKESQNV